MGKKRFCSIFRLPLIALAAMLVALGAMGHAEPSTQIISHHDPEFQRQHGFGFRRINLTFENALSSSLSFRFKLETSSSGDFISNFLLVPFVKDAFLNYNFLGQDPQVGIISTPSGENIEPLWGYRVLEKTPCDLQMFGSSRDFGISLRGLVIGEVGWKITENIVIIPNIKHVFYDKLEEASGYRSDTYLNLSAGLEFLGGRSPFQIC